MVVELSLQTDEQGRVVPAVQGQALAEPTLLTSLPSLEVLQTDPFNPGRAPKPPPWTETLVRLHYVAIMLAHLFVTFNVQNG